jgi:hypothetical protein
MTCDIAAAYHEAAHVIVAHAFGLRTIAAKIEDEGTGTTTLAFRKSAIDPINPVLHIITSMAGSAAECVLLGVARDDVPDSGDRENQASYAAALTPSRKHDWQSRCWQCACAYVREFHVEIAALADELLLERQLTGFALSRAIERAAHTKLDGATHGDTIRISLERRTCSGRHQKNPAPFRLRVGRLMDDFEQHELLLAFTYRGRQIQFRPRPKGGRKNISMRIRGPRTAAARA